MRILVVEDSSRMAAVLKKGLTEECYAVDVAADGITGLHMAGGGEYDLVLLDVNLPGMDGFALLRALREKRSDVPVVMVTARDNVRDRIEGLDSGADDYVVKPFSFEELLARIRATMRRAGAREEPELRFEDIMLNPARGHAERGGRPLSLSAREFALLRTFLANAGRVMTRARLYESVWNAEYDGLSNVLDVYVNYLRNKLESGGGSRVIHTVRGRGYQFGAPPDGPQACP
ncbi:MAG TPA: response regulator transcription factor [Planctomycetota bacterium]|nr:response regulator transcription factor [Planctomycetota bacterium]